MRLYAFEGLPRVAPLIFDNFWRSCVTVSYLCICLILSSLVFLKLYSFMELITNSFNKVYIVCLYIDLKCNWKRFSSRCNLLLLVGRRESTSIAQILSPLHYSSSKLNSKRRKSQKARKHVQSLCKKQRICTNIDGWKPRAKTVVSIALLSLTGHKTCSQWVTYY